MLVIFDLDGTLIDSSRDLAISMNATREHVGMPPLAPTLIYSYVGSGAAALVRRALGPDASEELLERALSFFLKFYRAHALENTQLYPGVREAVEAISQSSGKLAVLTNKPVRISADILAALGLQKFFFRVYGGDSFPSKKPDPVGVIALMEEAQMLPSQTLLVGDSSIDIRTARNAGVRSCGVAWGFQPDSLQAEPPDVLISEPRELLDQLVPSHR